MTDTKKKTPFKLKTGKKDKVPEVVPEQASAEDDDDILSDQLQDLRGELKSKLPEPEKFLSFEKAVADREDDDDPKSPGRFPNSPRFLIRFGAIAMAVSFVIVLGLVLFLRVEVPSVVGMTAVEASETLIESGLNFEIFEEDSADVAAGQVIATTPAAGEQAIRGITVAVRVSADNDLVSIPDIRGLDLEEARAKITASRLSIDVVQTFDSSQPRGSVVGFLPALGTRIPAGSPVTLLVSAGVLETTIEVPDVRNLTEDAARGVLEDAGLNPVFYHAATTAGMVNRVAAQTPGENNIVSPGSPVLVMVSTGNSTTDHPVPDLSGSTEQSALAALEQAGFVPESFNMIYANAAAGTVISQMPPAENALLRSGEPVGFLVSAGEQAEVEVPSVLALDKELALEAILDAGLNPVLIFAPGLVEDTDGNGGSSGIGIVTQQFPAGGSQYHLGLPVLIYLSLQD